MAIFYAIFPYVCCSSTFCVFSFYQQLLPFKPFRSCRHPRWSPLYWLCLSFYDSYHLAVSTQRVLIEQARTKYARLMKARVKTLLEPGACRSYYRSFWNSLYGYRAHCSDIQVAVDQWRISGLCPCCWQMSLLFSWAGIRSILDPYRIEVYLNSLDLQA